MSSHSLLEVECPSCGKKREIVIWQMVDVTREPERREEIFTGKINYFTCDGCDFEGFITAPLVYLDMEKEFCVQYVPVEFFEDTGYLKESFTPDGGVRTGLPANTAESPELSCMQGAHIVFSMAELIRYVLFRERLGQVFAETGGES